MCFKAHQSHFVTEFIRKTLSEKFHMMPGVIFFNIFFLEIVFHTKFDKTIVLSGKKSVNFIHLFQPT